MPTGEARGFQFLGRPTRARPTRSSVRQTYSDGSVVDWTGPENSETPAPTIEARARSAAAAAASTLAMVALIVGGLGLMLGIVALAAGPGGARSLETPLRVALVAAVAALALPAAALAHAALCGRPFGSGTVNTPPKQLSSPTARPSSLASPSCPSRTRGRAADRRAAGSIALEPGHARRAAEEARRRPGTSSGGVSSPRTAIPCAALSRSPSARTPALRRSS